MNKTHDRILNDSAEVLAMPAAQYRDLMQRFARYLESRPGYVTVAMLAERFSVRQGTIYTMCEDADAHDFWVNLAAWHQHPGDALVSWGSWRHRQKRALEEPAP